MAKPSIRICNASIYKAAATWAVTGEQNSCSRVNPGACRSRLSVRGNLDEVGELQLAFGDFLGPNAGLFAILPLQHQAGDQALAVFQTVGELVVLAVKLDAADGAFPVGLFQRVHNLVSVGRAS